ncbi:D-aminoacyl-tRNA deacylase [Azoarcus taiwanensis]|uniref:D-aminoacyl-tRNA deacylase n=1 Tax=Azoarcus taiwanensis TaxID=666964 RepID=A0A972J9I9_9RHOO|nr:D-aminoacyl-tRNA deacylase [Azoarcus taiwanensis]NMG04914.1 D-tyrosyl-tRNA(Tyr) deacylase [Azoarcus taiwanensis]
MIALIQRVLSAKVEVSGETVGAIGPGILALVGVEREDGERNVMRLAERLLAYRIFQDEQNRMNLSVQDVGGGLLLVPQFTLAADTRKGNRPGFSTAAEPERATRLFEELVARLRESHAPVATGRFGAEMIVSLQNHGPVTFWLQA